eukprot:6376550-Lingulodinium_polyedra.AAC.1
MRTSDSWSRPSRGSGAWAMFPPSSSGISTWGSTAAVSRVYWLCPGGRTPCGARGPRATQAPGPRPVSTGL